MSPQAGGSNVEFLEIPFDVFVLAPGGEPADENSCIDGVLAFAFVRGLRVQDCVPVRAPVEAK